MKEVGLTVGAEKTLEQATRRWWTQALWWMAGLCSGTCGIEGVFGRTCATRDCAQISSSEQVLGEKANCVGFIMDHQETTL